MPVGEMAISEGSLERDGRIVLSIGDIIGEYQRARRNNNTAARLCQDRG